MKTTALLVCSIFFFITSVSASPVEKKGAASLAVIPGVGDRQPSDLVMANLEVRLSQCQDIDLVERALINKILQEAALSASGLQAQNQAIQIGRLVQADILLFVEKVLPADRIQESGTPSVKEDIIRIRLVESQTGIILASLMEKERQLQGAVETVMPAVQKAVAKQRIGFDDRQYLGLMGIKNNEPGTLLDGTAEALSVLLAFDLAAIPDIFVLEREHLQYLQTERALTGMELKLKKSTLVLDGGLQFEPGQKEIRVSMTLRPLTPSRQAQTIPLTVPKGSLQEVRRLVIQSIMDRLEASRMEEKDVLSDVEGELFLQQVPLYLFSRDFESAVSHAEVAYALLPSQDARYWAAWAWYALGWDLVNKSVPDVLFIKRIKRVTSRTRTTPMKPAGGRNMIGDQFSPGRTKAIPLRDVSRLGQERPQVRTERDNTQPAVQRHIINPSGPQPERETPPLSVTEGDSSILDQQIRYLSALLRSYSLMEELSRVHIEEYETQRQKNIVIRDPRDQFENTFWEPDRKINLVLTRRIDKKETEVQFLFDQLVNVRNRLNKLQRDFYFRHYNESVKAQAAYWEAWLDKKEMIARYYGFHPVLSAEIIAQGVEAFMKTGHGQPTPRMKGLIDLLSLTPSRALSSEEEEVYKGLVSHPDPFVRLVVNKQLMRIDPIDYADEVVQVLLKEFPYDHPCRQMADPLLLPRLVTPAFQRLAISRRETMLAAGEQLFGPILKNEDITQLVAWKDCLWPYFNGLEATAQTEKLVANIQQAVRILEDNDYMSFSRWARLLRAECDVKLVQLGQKETHDPRFELFFKYRTAPYYIRVRPEIEAPRLDDQPLDLSGIEPVQLPTRGKNTTVVSRSSETLDANGTGGRTFHKGYTRIVDAEGNETYTIYNMDAQEEKKKETGPWSEYTIRTIPLKVAPIRDVEIRGALQGSGALQRTCLLDEDTAFIVFPEREGDDLVVTAYQHNLLDNPLIHELGKVHVPLNHIKDYFPYFVTDMAVGPDHLYIATAGGLIVLPKDQGKKIQDIRRHRPRYEPYEPYYISEKDKRQQKASQDAYLLTEADGFPGNEILSLAYFRGTLYVGLGPLNISRMGLIGNCGFATFDPQTKTYDLIASSRSAQNRNPLEQGDPYQITSILGDEQRGCLWLSLAGNPKYNGIWRYDPERRTLEHVVPEDFDVQIMRWADGDIVYMMKHCGLVQFDPESLRKTWLLVHTWEKRRGFSEFRPPKGYTGDPVFGLPETRIWPFAMKDGRLFTVSWDAYDVLLHQRGEGAVGKSVFDLGASAVDAKIFLDQNEHGIWIITALGSVYLVQ